MERNEVLSSLKQSKVDIHQKYRVKKIGLFGSFARGTQGENSDIDIYAEFESDADILDYSALSLELEKMFHRSVDIATPNAIREDMKSSILRDLIVV